MLRSSLIESRPARGRASRPLITRDREVRNVVNSFEPREDFPRIMDDDPVPSGRVFLQ